MVFRLSSSHSMMSTTSCRNLSNNPTTGLLYHSHTTITPAPPTTANRHLHLRKRHELIAGFQRRRRQTPTFPIARAPHEIPRSGAVIWFVGVFRSAAGGPMTHAEAAPP